MIATGLLLTGCASTPPSRPTPTATDAPSPSSEFEIAAGQLDTWNAIGQIVTHTQGVTYRGRAQMMGLYDVEYRGEKLLLVAHAFVLDDHIKTPTTQVRVAAGDGSADVSAAALDLLHQIQAQLPDELRHIAEQGMHSPAPKHKIRTRRR